MAVHPRDHVLCVAFQGQTTMTVLANVSCKVRVNGGAATTYTSATSPAVAQAQDCNFSYHLELAAGSFADGDRVSRTWLYNGVAVAYGDTIIGLAEVDGAHYTTARGDKLDNLDAAISSVSASVWNALTSGLTTVGSIGKLLVTNIDAALSSIKAKTDLLGAATVNVSSPVASAGALTLFAGDDYKAADGRAVTFTINPGWPSLVGASVALHIDALSVTGAIGATLSFDLTKAQTATLTGVKRYTVVATLSDGSIVTLAAGACTTT